MYNSTENYSEKKWATKVGDKLIYHGAKGYNIGRKGSDKWKSYCSRSAGIARKYPSARELDSPNSLSRKKWRCGEYGF